MYCPVPQINVSPFVFLVFIGPIYGPKVLRLDLFVCSNEGVRWYSPPKWLCILQQCGDRFPLPAQFFILLFFCCILKVSCSLIMYQNVLSIDAIMTLLVLFALPVATYWITWTWLAECLAIAWPHSLPEMLLKALNLQRPCKAWIPTAPVGFSKMVGLHFKRQVGVVWQVRTGREKAGLTAISCLKRRLRWQNQKQRYFFAQPFRNCLTFDNWCSLSWPAAASVKVQDR